MTHLRYTVEYYQFHKTSVFTAAFSEALTHSKPTLNLPTKADLTRVALATEPTADLFNEDITIDTKTTLSTCLRPATQLEAAETLLTHTIR